MSETVNLKERFQHYWHLVYYFFFRRCKDVAELIDLGAEPSTFIGRVRFRLHLVFCKACRNYLNLNDVLRDVIRGALRKSLDSSRLHRLNQKLLQKFSKGEKS